MACRAQHTLAIACLAVGAGAAPLLATAGTDSTARLWHGRSGHAVCTALLPAPARCAALAPLQDALYVGLQTGAIVRVPQAQLTAAAASGGSGAHVPAAGVGAGRASSGKAATVIPVEESVAWEHHKGAVNSVALAPDGLHLVSGMLTGGAMAEPSLRPLEKLRPEHRR